MLPESPWALVKLHVAYPFGSISIAHAHLSVIRNASSNQKEKKE